MINNIVCFYWQGDRWRETAEGPIPKDISYARHLDRVGTVSRELASKYVNNLLQGVLRFSKEPFNFICFTNEDLDLDQGVEVRPLKMVTTKGVMPRMYMFSKEAGLFGSQVLSLDLDLLITGSLDDLISYRGLFCTRKSFTRGEETQLDGDIMSFTAGEETEKMFYTPLTQNLPLVDEISQGRERFWVRYVMDDVADTWQDLFPGQVCSYKHHVLKAGKLPPNARIVSCHGFPRPHQITHQWRTTYWK